MGASWIEGVIGNPMTALARRARAKPYPHPLSAETQYLTGRDHEITPMQEAAFEQGQELFDAQLEKATKVRVLGGGGGGREGGGGARGEGAAGAQAHGSHLIR